MSIKYNHITGMIQVYYLYITIKYSHITGIIQIYFNKLQLYYRYITIQYSFFTCIIQVWKSWVSKKQKQKIEKTIFQNSFCRSPKFKDLWKIVFLFFVVFWRPNTWANTCVKPKLADEADKSDN